ESIRNKRHQAGWDTKFLEEILRGSVNSRELLMRRPWLFPLLRSPLHCFAGLKAPQPDSVITTSRNCVSVVGGKSNRRDFTFITSENMNFSPALDVPESPGKISGLWDKKPTTNDPSPRENKMTITRNNQAVYRL